MDLDHVTVGACASHVGALMILVFGAEPAETVHTSFEGITWSYGTYFTRAQL